MLLYAAKRMIKLRVLRRGAYPGLSPWVLHAITRILYKRKVEGFGGRHREGGNMKMGQRLE